MSVITAIAACSPPANEASTIVGVLEDRDIDEASGLATSRVDSNTFWVINDDGPAVLYAINATGKSLGRVRIADASNKDWEDLASFRMNDTSYLLVADTGDNESKRKSVSLYVVVEPDAGQSKSKEYRRIEVRYPDGPRDAEAIAVDAAQQRALILSKREVPAVLFSVSLAEAADAKQTAIRLGVVGTLPQPSKSDVELAPKTDEWFWQVTGFDISADGSAAVILTYGGVFLYHRSPEENWIDALQRPPEVVSRTRNRQAESVAFNATGDAIYITLEQRNAPLFRLDLEGVPSQ